VRGKKYFMTGPEGGHDIEVTTPEGDRVTGMAVLTGKSLNVSEASGDSIFMFIGQPFVWIFITAILGFVAFTIYRKGYKRSFIGYIHSKKKGMAKKHEDAKIKKIHTNSLINPKNIDALENKGAYLLRMNKEQEAMECFDEVLKITERNVCSLFNRGMILKKKRRYWDALFSFDKGLELCPDDEDALRCVDDILSNLIKNKVCD